MRKYILVFFILILLAELLAICLEHQTLQYFLKPLLLPILMLYFAMTTIKYSTPLKKWILLALVLSWIGDILLLFQGRDQVFFLLGLSSFLLAHICYIIFFQKLRLYENIHSRAWLLFPVLIYYIVLIRLLSPHLGEMKLPVQIYGIVISFMLLLAFHMTYARNRAAGLLMMAGAGFFVLSDSLLAFDKFYNPFPYAGIFIMLTYGLAQMCIVVGAGKYIRALKSL